MCEIPLLRSQPFISVYSKIVTLVIDNASPLLTVGIILQQPLFVRQSFLMRGLILISSITSQPLQQLLWLLTLPVQDCLLLLGAHQGGTEETRSRALLSAHHPSTPKAVGDKCVFYSLTLAWMSACQPDYLIVRINWEKPVFPNVSPRPLCLPWRKGGQTCLDPF